MRYFLLFSIRFILLFNKVIEIQIKMPRGHVSFLFLISIVVIYIIYNTYKKPPTKPLIQNGDERQPCMLHENYNDGYWRIPKLTIDGVTPPNQIDPSIHNQILQFYQHAKQNNQTYREHTNDFFHKDYNNNMFTLPVQHRQLLETFIQYQVEWWSYLNTHHTATYGLREYGKTSKLPLHTDVQTTHILSAIVNIDQDLGGGPDWPLVIYDNHCNKREVYLKPGQFILYESATCEHGRPDRFQGNRFVNVFLHFRPNNWEYMLQKQFLPIFKNIAPYISNTLFYQPRKGMSMYADKDEAQWNNVRQACEMSLCIAYKLQRTFIPPKREMWHGIDTPVHIFDYFDENTFKSVIPTLDYSPNMKMKRLQYRREMSIDENVNILQNESGKRIYLDYRLFGKHPPEYDTLIHSAFRFRKDVLIKVSNILISYNLMPGTYCAMHVRRGDFIYGRPGIGDVSSSTIFNHTKDAVSGQRLLIISDQRDEQLLQLFSSVCSEVICWTGHRQQQFNSMLLDMLCCVPASRFFGTPLSTLSSGIVTLRKRVGTFTQRDFTIPFDYANMPYWGLD